MFGIIFGHCSRISGPRPSLLAQVLGSLPDRSRLWGSLPTLGLAPDFAPDFLASLPTLGLAPDFAPDFGASLPTLGLAPDFAPDFGASLPTLGLAPDFAPDFGASLPTLGPRSRLRSRLWRFILGLGGLANDLGFVGAWWSKFELFYIFLDQTTTFRWFLEFTTRVQPFPSNRKPTHFGCVSLHIFTSQANGSAYLFLCMLFVCSAGRCQRSGAFCCRRHCSYVAR